MNKNFLTRIISFVLAAMMILTSLPINTFAEADEPNTGNTEKKTMNYDNTPIGKEQINGDLEVKVAKPGANEKAEDFIKNPDMPKLYTIRADYKVKRGDDLVINYQPYIVTVGDIDYTYTDQFGNKNMRVLTEEEKVKINKDINLPNLDGYTKPTEKYNVNYAFVKNPKGIKDFKDIKKNNERKYNKEFIYKPESNKIKIRHIFQHLYDRDKYGEPKTGDKVDPKEKIKKDIVTQQEGLTGTSMKVQPLQGEDIKGYEPEVNAITTQVPENVADFELIFRYNRKKYILKYDTQDGTPIPSRTIYYEQTIPRLELVEVPTKRGCEFQGWKPSVNLEDRSGKTYLKDNIIKDSKGNAIVDLSQSIFEKDTEGKIVNDTDGKPKNTNSKDAALDLIMPASNVTFTAVWKDKEKADYAVQFWAEKADHADGASLMDKYDYMGTRVYKDKDTGMRPNLDAESPGPVEVEVNGQKDTLPGLNFPDLDNTRLQKIWKGDRFNRGKNLYLNKFYVYNKDLTDEQNKDPKTNITKTVSATGQTIYNIYYDRQVYDLYFTKSNAQPEKNTIYPEIWGYDEAKGEAVMKGGPGNPYHYKARFNEMMYKWPNDAKQTKGFTLGYQSFGWGPNYTTPNWPTHLDTPPYRLNAGEFLDMDNYTSWGGYTKHIDKGDGTTIDLEPIDFTTLSFGIKQDSPSIPHHMDFWMDGFKDGETIIRYDLVRTKADTAGLDYGHKYPIVTGFTPYGYDPKKQWPSIKEGSEENGRVDEDGIDKLNDKRDEITPNTSGTYYNNNGIKLPIGQLDFIPAFFSDSDEFGDVKEGGQAFTENGYLQFKYTRNKYPLRFNYDPSIIRDDSYFNSTNQLETFYEFPLKVLSPDVVPELSKEQKEKGEKKEYFKDNPANLLDNPENLKKLNLTDLVENDSDGKLRVKRPKGLSAQMVFKGWALDPAGTKLIWKNPGEKMPSHPVNLYAKWGEPDFKWKVTYDPNGGELPEIDPNTITTENKTIKEGDIGKEKENTYPVKGFEAESEEGSNVKEGNKVFTVIQRQKLADTVRPWREGYDFMGWEFVKYKKSADGKDTDVEDKTYFDTYGVPEIYTFGNDVVSNLYLRAIWVKNDLIDIMSYHHYINADYTEDKDNVIKQTLEKRRIDAFLGAVGSRQNTERLLVPKEEFEKLEKNNTVYQEYITLKDASGKPRSNTYNQYIRVKKENTVNSDGTITEIPENKKYNEFHFFYRPFRKREYKVNYIDERGKEEIEKFFKKLKLKDINDLKELLEDEDFKKLTKEEQEEKKEEKILEFKEENKKKFEDKRKDFEKIIKKYQVIEPEAVINGNRDYDARNYRVIPGWKLVSAPQQQLFFDVGKDNEFLGINGTGSDEITFYYKDVRVVEVPGDKEPPKGYVRVTFKADKGGSFGKDAEGKDITELHYDVIKGLQSQLLPVPKELAEGETADKDKHYITPETGKKFIKWDKSPLLNDNTIIKEAHTFTAYFEWSGLSASGLVRTEAFKDPDGKWTNDFAPTIDQLKAQLVWMEKGKVAKLPAGAVIKLFDEAGTELTTDKQVYELVNEKNALDKDELVRTVNVKAKVTFKDGKEPQELTIPITVYKNVYEALNKKGDKPLFLKEAEGKDAKDGGLKEILKDNTENRYIKVTIKPNKDFTNKDDKVYYVNPNAWVEISNDSNGTAALINWTADQDAQNENNAANGKFDFGKRHKFTEDTIISPRLSQTSELVAHESYKDSKNNWVNDFIDKELTKDKLKAVKAAIQVKNGSATALGDGDTVTIVDDAGEPYANDDALKTALYEKLQEKDDNGKVSRIENIKVKVTFANGEVQTLTLPVKVIKNIYEAKTKTGKPDYVPANYVKVTLDPTTKAKDPQKYFYYVNPDAKVLIPGKDPEGVKEEFTGWTMKADSATGAGISYKLNDRHQFAEDSTIIAQYGQGKANIKYVDDSGKEIDSKYHIDGEDYPKEKIGKLGDNVPDPAYNQDAEKAAAPKFKGYIISDVIVIKNLQIIQTLRLLQSLTLTTRK
nr:InlB B-repeat-containing protein [Ezakiella coagulans]